MAKDSGLKVWKEYIEKLWLTSWWIMGGICLN